MNDLEIRRFHRETEDTVSKNSENQRQSKRNKIMKINMTEEIYLAPGGTKYISLTTAPYCAYGKILQACGIKFADYPAAKAILKRLGITDQEYNQVADINDGRYTTDPPNHYRALKLAIQLLQEKGHEVILPEVAFAEEPAKV